MAAHRSMVYQTFNNGGLFPGRKVFWWVAQCQDCPYYESHWDRDRAFSAAHKHYHLTQTGVWNDIIARS